MGQVKIYIVEVINLSISNAIRFNNILTLFPLRIKNLLYQLPDRTKESIKEIRVRKSKPIVVVSEKGNSFLNNTSKLTYIYSESLPVVNGEEIDEIIKRVCNYSIYTHQQDINRGFITVKGGHRVGICGSAVIDKGKTVSVRDLNSLNIRIASEVYGCADELMKKLFYNKVPNVILAGPPMCGKTTVLRDLVRQISYGNSGEYKKCVLLDERGEIACVENGECYCDVGPNTDVLTGYTKDEAINIAVRTMSPEAVFSDEISDDSEAKDILNGIMCGSSFVVTSHAADLTSLKTRSVTNVLLESKLFDYCVFLGVRENLGRIERIINLRDENYEKFRNSNSVVKPFCGGELLRKTY